MMVRLTKDATSAAPRAEPSRASAQVAVVALAHAAFGGYKQSGIGRETHKMMLDHYQQTKNILMSYNPNKLGFF